MHLPTSAALVSLLALSSVASAHNPSAQRKHWSRKHQSLARQAESQQRRSPIVLPANGFPTSDSTEAIKREMKQFEDRALGQAPGNVQRRAVSCKIRPSSSSAPTASSSKIGATTSSSAAAVKATSSSSVNPSSSSSSSAPTSSSTKAAAPTTTSTTSSSSSKVATSTSSSSAAAAATSTSAASTSSFLRGWSSSSGSSSGGNALYFSPLSTVDLGTCLAAEKGKMGPIGSAPDGTQAMIATYPAGEVGGSSAWSYYSNYEPSVLESATEAVLGYSVYFPSDFQWVKGGKLPGLFGGTEGQYGCSGGNQDTRDVCWSARLMWRADGAGEVYTYFPLTDANTAACEASGNGAYCDDATYGLSFGRKNFYWNSGSWNTVQERVKLNTPGKQDGYIYLTINGVEAIRAENVELITTSSAGFSGIFMSTFFGGSDASTWSPSSDQKAYFSDFSLGVLA